MWPIKFVCLSAYASQHACGCLGACRCFGRKHKAHWPGLKTLPFQLNSPQACSSAGLIWGGGMESGREGQRERETDRGEEEVTE